MNDVIEIFPAADVRKLLMTLIQNGKNYRARSIDDAKQGRLVRAFEWHKAAEQNLSQVNWWLNRHEELRKEFAA